ncbi:MAG: CarD family transcriptional regulator, partial [Methylococcales bacterium]
MDSVATADKNHSPLSPPSVSSHQTAHYWTQLNGCADSLAFASTIEKSESFQLIVTADTPSALRYEHEIGFFQTNSTPVLHFPDWETLPYDVFSPLPEIISERLRTLSRLPQVRKGVLVVSIATLMHRISPRQHILASTFVLERGGRLDLDETRSNLEHVGYQCVPQVYQHGEFAVRGSIIDLFPMGNSAPYRIELFDDEIESIRTFDPESQRSLEKVDNINLFPAREFPFTDEAIKQYRQAFRNYFPNTDTRCSLYQDVTQGILPGGIEYYLPLFVEKTDTLFDYLPKDTTLVLTEEVQRAAREFQQEIESRFEQRRHDTSRPILAPEDLYLSPEKLFGRMENYARVYINGSEAGSAADSPLVFSTQPLPDLSLQSGPNQVATEALESFLNGFSGKTLFVAETAGHREMLLETLRRHEIKPVTLNQWSDFLSTDEVLSILVAPIDHGLWMANPAIAIITETQLTGERAQQRRRRRRSSAQDLENIVANLSELQIGAPVVHRDHGIGRYAGLNRLTVGAVDTEFLTLEYANNDKLYVPVASLHLIGRYSGGDPDLAPIHRLGGDQWQKAKKRAMEKARDVAVELLDSHANRAARQGFSFEVGGDEYETFALAFPFEETPDQQTAIDQVVEDMLSDKAMDRVVCGDVGFGKTEVAMRAAFVAVENNKQVAILVPTTLLAQQHFQSFIDRFVDWPVRIEVLSRFV